MSDGESPGPARRHRRLHHLPRVCRSGGSGIPSLALRAFLNAVAVGILLFLFWDVLAGGIEPVESALDRRQRPRRLLVALRSASARCSPRASPSGCVSLVYYDRWLRRRPTPRRGARARPPPPSVDSARGPHRAPERTEAPRVLHRARHRPPQLLRGPGDRPVGRVRRDQPRAAAHHRVRAPQRDRGIRHRRADGRRGRAADVGVPRPARASSAAGRRSSARSSASRGSTRRSSSRSSRSPPARSSTS